MTAPRKPAKHPSVYTTAEAAAILRVSRWHVQRQITAGTIRALRLGRAIRIPEVEIQRLLAGDK